MKLQEDPRVSLGAINCAENNYFCNVHKVSGYPTLRAFHFPGNADSETEKGYDVPRNNYAFDELIKFVTNKLQKMERASTTTTSPLTTVLAAETALPGIAKPSAAKLTALSNAGRPKPQVASPGKAAAVGMKRPAAARHPTPALRLLDAEVALVYSLRQGVYLATEPQQNDKPPQLGKKALTELVAWLEFVSKVLPSSRACEDVAKLALVARSALEHNGFLQLTAWEKAMDEHTIDRVPPAAGKDPSAHWWVCSTYTCGLWALFHIATVASSQAHAPKAFKNAFLGPGMNEQPEALVRIRGFVANFFGCNDCVNNFLEAWDNCTYGVCLIKRNDDQGAVMWLWRMHNDVTKRVAIENKEPAESQNPWPAIEDCADCWRYTHTVPWVWDSTAVYAYLERNYWQPEWKGGQEASGVIDYALAGCALVVLSVIYVAWRLGRGSLISNGLKKGR